MRVLLTGGFGNVGRSTLAALLAQGDDIRVLEADTPANRRNAALLGRGATVMFGDVRDPAAAREALVGREAVIHLAALIPPGADKAPDLAHSINVDGTARFLEAAASLASPPRFVLASSIAAYGDRLESPWIRTQDPLDSNQEDGYGRSKVEAEALVKSSGLPWSILRLSYIVWRKKLKRDPLMFHMPPSTRIEVCHTEDTGRAFAAAARLPGAEGGIFDIGGGEPCRTTFRAYLDRMFSLFGLGSSAFLPDEAFASKGFHCGWYADSDQAEEVLHFRRKSIEDYYREVGEETRWLRPWARLVAPVLKRAMLSSSPFLNRGRALA